MNYYTEVSCVADRYVVKENHAYAVGALTAWAAEILYYLPPDVAERFIARMHAAISRNGDDHAE